MNAYENAFPLFKEYGYEATSFINSDFIGRSGYLSWEQVHDLANNNWEIGGHTVTHAELMELDDDEAYAEIAEGFQNFSVRGLNLVSFALPAGHASERDYSIIKSFYKNIRNSIDKQIHIPINRFDLGYFAYQTEYNSEMVKQRINMGSINGEVLIVIGFHRISDDPGYALAKCTIKDLEEILNWVAEKDFQVMRLDKAINKLLNTK